MEQRTGTPLVSVIVPVYNAELFLRRCLDSIFGQTLKDFEVIVVNDGSTDSSSQILREYESKHANMTVLDQRNIGQGAARNRALDLSRGKYVLFVDADDFIESVLLQVTTERAQIDQSDLVHFDWKLNRSGDAEDAVFAYDHTEPFWHLYSLEGDECELLFRMNSYFSVTNLYLREFLIANEIHYEVGQIYEDNPFLAQVFSRAERVSLVHSPLYVVQVHSASSTKRGNHTDLHMRDHLTAIGRSFEKANFRTQAAPADLAEYHLEKFATYFERRVPVTLRSQYAAKFVAALEPVDWSAASFSRKTSWLTIVLIKLNVFEGQRAATLNALVKIKMLVTPPAKRVLSAARTLKRKTRHPLRTITKAPRRNGQSVEPGLVLFLGFDFRYVGNSRALFEMLRDENELQGIRLLFATRDTEVPKESRVRPYSMSFLRTVQRAEFVIAESWVPEAIVKNPRSTWIQLWHGTPMKRMLFDSHEHEISLARPAHKNRKYWDIQRWDYFVVDDEVAFERFSTAFLIPAEKMLLSPYPRVERLQSRQALSETREDLLLKIGVPHSLLGRTIVLYAPTWRDYNFGKKSDEQNREYLVDREKLAELLGEQYFVLFKDHDYLAIDSPKPAGEALSLQTLDIEDLLLASDVLVTDYSSLAFDARRIRLPVVLFQPDREAYLRARGLYKVDDQIEEDLSGLVAAVHVKANTRLIVNRASTAVFTDLPEPK